MMHLPSLLFLILVCTCVSAQNNDWVASDNLVANGGFEQYRHLETKPAGRLATDDFAYALPGWTMTCADPVVCTSRYTGDAVDTSNWYCLDGELEVFSGDVMVELRYGNNCWSPAMEEPGCAATIGYQLNEPLNIGKVYELSCWLYIQPPDDPDYVNHIGASFYRQKLAYRANRMLEGTDFRLDTVIYNKWFLATWLVRPICELSYLSIGTFRDLNGPSVRYKMALRNSFFVDDVSLREVTESVSQQEAIIPFCLYEEQGEKVAPEVPGATINFASASDKLDSSAVILLDEFALRFKENPGTIYTISGHTDATGNDHRQLSERRIMAALTYLEAQHGITELRFLRLPMGADRAVATNDEERGRQKNRRVEILQLSGEPVTLIYRKLIDAIWAGDLQTAAKRLFIWSNVAKPEELLLAQKDPRLKVLLSDKTARRLFEERIAAVYPRLAKPNGARQLDSLWAEDQAPRTLNKWLENLRYYYPDLDDPDSLWYVAPLVSLQEANEKNMDNLRALEVWIEQYGWPQRTVVGNRAAKAAPLVLLHSGDTTAMQRYLPLAEAACRQGEGDWGYYALLYDRLCVTRELPQRFGTQYRKNSAGEMELCPEENPEMTKIWRRELGL